MASLKGVKVIDMTDGVITKITYKGEEYTQVTEGRPKAGDIGLRVKEGFHGVVAIGSYYEITTNYSGLNSYICEDGDRVTISRSNDSFEYFRKVVNLVGKFAVFSQVRFAYLTEGKYYEIVSEDPMHLAVIDDIGEKQLVLIDKQASTFTYEIHDEKPKFKIGDYVVPTSSSRYTYTSKPHMKLGKVVQADYSGVSDIIRVEIVAIEEWYSSHKGEKYSVDSKVFAKADEATIAKYTSRTSKIKSEKRKAEVGDRIIITNTNPINEQEYENGDIFEVTEVDAVCFEDVLVKGLDSYVDYHEYEVVVEGGSGDTLKEGDLARVVGNTFSGKVVKGRIVEIIRDADSEGVYRIETGYGVRDYAKAESLSKLESDDEIGVGDIVRVTEYRNGFPVGTLGEVVAVDGDGRVRVRAIMRPAGFITFIERNVELVAKASDRADIDV